MIITDLKDDYTSVLPSIKAISIYESFNYDISDLEVLSQSQRRHLINRAKSFGFEQKSGKWLIHPDGTRIFFPTQKMFNRDFRSFLPSEQSEDTWLAVTPTQAAYMMLCSKAFDQVDLYQHMMTQPFNLSRLNMALEHEDCFSLYVGHAHELNRLFERAKVMLKNKLPLDKLQL